jgi:hypothetical protein
MTSLFLELVSVPTEPCFSINTVDAPSLACNFRAIVNPTTPPPITACVKSDSLLVLVENDLEHSVLAESEMARDENIMRSQDAKKEPGLNYHTEGIMKRTKV